MKALWPKQLFAISFLIFFFSSLLPSLYGQAVPQAKRDSDISAYGMYSYVNPDFGGHNNPQGAIFGVDYIRFLNRYVDPGLEFRANISPGSPVNQHVYSIGLKGQARIRQVRWLHPYGDFLIGYGTMHFDQPYNPIKGKTTDSSTVWTYGTGIDIDFHRQWAARVDYQWSHWNIGQGLTLAPTSFGAGVVYHFDFGRR